MSWLNISERVIRDALSKVPQGASFNDASAAIAAAYPFGERRMHPYKQWLKARQSALQERFPAKFEKPVQKMVGGLFYGRSDAV